MRTIQIKDKLLIAYSESVTKHLYDRYIDEDIKEGTFEDIKSKITDKQFLKSENFRKDKQRLLVSYLRYLNWWAEFYIIRFYEVEVTIAEGLKITYEYDNTTTEIVLLEENYCGGEIVKNLTSNLWCFVNDQMKVQYEQGTYGASSIFPNYNGQQFKFLKYSKYLEQRKVQSNFYDIYLNNLIRSLYKDKTLSKDDKKRIFCAIPPENYQSLFTIDNTKSKEIVQKFVQNIGAKRKKEQENKAAYTSKLYNTEYVNNGIDYLRENIIDTKMFGTSANALVKPLPTSFLKVQSNDKQDNIKCDVIVLIKLNGLFIKYLNSFPVLIENKNKLSKIYLNETPNAPIECPALVTSLINVSTTVENLEKYITERTGPNNKLFEMLEALFIKLCTNSITTRFVHNDAHICNILYDTLEKELVLIDYGRSYVNLTGVDFNILNQIKKLKDIPVNATKFYENVNTPYRILPIDTLLIPALCDVASIAYQVYKMKYKSMKQYRSILSLEMDQNGEVMNMTIPYNRDSLFIKLNEVLDKTNILFACGLAWFVEYLFVYLDIKNISSSVINISDKIIKIPTKNYTTNLIFAEKTDEFKGETPFLRHECGIFHGKVFNNLQSRLTTSEIQKKVNEYITNLATPASTTRSPRSRST